MLDECDWAEREWELRRKNEAIEERQKHTIDFYLVGDEEGQNDVKSMSKGQQQQQFSALARSLHQCKLHNDKLTREVETLKKERTTLLSDLKVARLQLRKPPLKDEGRSELVEMGREVVGLRRELEEAKREAKKVKMAAEGEAVRAGRAAEEVAKLKEERARTREEIKELRGALESAKLESRVAYQSKEKQYKQLVAAFKKQAELVHVLRQQKLHLEASMAMSGMLNTEEK